MSWPLWYLLALIWASFLVKIMLKWKMKVEWILISGLCLTLIGWGVKYVLETEHADDCLEKIVYVYKKTFVGTRNGLFVGFGFVSVGMFLGKWQDYFLRHTVWSCWVAALSVAAFLYDLPFSTHLLCFCILLFVIRIRLADRKAVSMVQTDEYVDLFFSHVFCCHFSNICFRKYMPVCRNLHWHLCRTFFFSCIVIRLMEVSGFSFLKKLVG